MPATNDKHGLVPIAALADIHYANAYPDRPPSHLLEVVLFTFIYPGENMTLEAVEQWTEAIDQPEPS